MFCQQTKAEINNNDNKYWKLSIELTSKQHGASWLVAGCLFGSADFTDIHTYIRVSSTRILLFIGRSSYTPSPTMETNYAYCDSGINNNGSDQQMIGTCICIVYLCVYDVYLTLAVMYCQGRVTEEHGQSRTWHVASNVSKLLANL